MRLGAFQAALDPSSRIAAVYGDTQISERHRHRYEGQHRLSYPPRKAGLKFAGLSPDGLLPETSNIRTILGSSASSSTPKLKSRPFERIRFFRSFITAAIEQSRLV